MITYYILHITYYILHITYYILHITYYILHKSNIIISNITSNYDFLNKSIYPNAKYFIQVDDDSYLHMPRLREYLAKFDRNVPLYAVSGDPWWYVSI
jgi:Fringe-like